MSKWKDLKGYEGLYQVSTDGKLRSMNYGGTGLVKEMAKCLDKYGYVKALLHKGGIRKHTTLHKLIAVTFIPNPENKPQINHKNGIKTDNRVDNLEWCTHKENSKHAKKNYLYENGEDRWSNKLSEIEVLDIHEISNKGNFTINEIAKKYDVSTSTVSAIKNEQRWKHLW